MPDRSPHADACLLQAVAHRLQRCRNPQERHARQLPLQPVQTCTCNICYTSLKRLSHVAIEGERRPRSVRSATPSHRPSAHKKTPYITRSMDFSSGKGVVWERMGHQLGFALTTSHGSVAWGCNVSAYVVDGLGVQRVCLCGRWLEYSNLVWERRLSHDVCLTGVLKGCKGAWEQGILGQYI